MRDPRTHWKLALLAGLPILSVGLLDDVPRFVFASCSYYSSTPCSAKTLTATPGAIPINGTSSIEFQDANCPCSWQIVSQPGGWQLQPGGNCVATLVPSPSQGWGNPGQIVIQATDGAGCQDTITVDAGSEMRVELSVDGGATWLEGGTTISSPPGSSLQFSVRSVVTIAEDTSHGWSYSIRHDDSALENAGGSLDLSLITEEGTHTKIAKSYSPPPNESGSEPDYSSTVIRSDSGGSTVGFVQGVVVDLDLAPGATLAPVIDFVTAGGCYALNVPTTAGVYQVGITFVDDLGDGKPAVKSLIPLESGTIAPNLRGFVLTVNSNQSGSSASFCDSLGPWK